MVYSRESYHCLEPFLSEGTVKVCGATPLPTPRACIPLDAISDDTYCQVIYLPPAYLCQLGG